MKRSAPAAGMSRHSRRAECRTAGRRASGGAIRYAVGIVLVGVRQARRSPGSRGAGRPRASADGEALRQTRGHPRMGPTLPVSCPPAGQAACSPAHLPHDVPRGRHSDDRPGRGGHRGGPRYRGGDRAGAGRRRLVGPRGGQRGRRPRAALSDGHPRRTVRRGRPGERERRGRPGGVLRRRRARPGGRHGRGGRGGTPLGWPGRGDRGGGRDRRRGPALGGSASPAAGRARRRPGRGAVAGPGRGPRAAAPSRAPGPGGSLPSRPRRLPAGCRCSPRTARPRRESPG